MDDGTTLWRVGVIAASRLVHLVFRYCRSGQWYFNIDRRAAATKKTSGYQLVIMAAAPPDEVLQHPVEVALPSECMDRRFFSR